MHSFIKNLGLCGSVALLFGTAPVHAFPRVSQQLAEEQFICFMHTNAGDSMDLRSLCGEGSDNYSGGSGSASSNSSSSSSSSSSSRSYSSGGGSSSSSGVCNVPSDRDSAGRRCGGRAASERPGGR
jgi:uncharacterized membrane protein YgcG